MLKVFLVEDEFIVREGIKNNIDWLAEGFIFCGEAADGELAFPLIQTRKPDIIITDIKMPFMNGLELSRLVVKELPQSKIIILSGHEEFSYAQEAIKIGVTEYLLKPIKGSELMKTVKRVGEQIILEKQERENYERYKREMAENETEAKRKLFNEMVAGSLSTEKIMERGKELRIDLCAKYYQIILFKYGMSDSDGSYSNELLALDKEINEINLRYKNIIPFDRSIEGTAYLLKGESPANLNIENALYHGIKNRRRPGMIVVKAFKEYKDVVITVEDNGIGMSEERLDQIRARFEQPKNKGQKPLKDSYGLYNVNERKCFDSMMCKAKRR